MIGTRFIGIKEGPRGPVAMFETGHTDYFYTASGHAYPSSQFCLLMGSLLTRIENLKKDSCNTSEEERALEALDKYQEVE